MVGNPLRRNQNLIASTIRTKGTLQRTAVVYGTIWTSWSEKGSENIYCTTPITEVVKQIQNLRGMILRDHPWERSMSLRYSR